LSWLLLQVRANTNNYLGSHSLTNLRLIDEKDEMYLRIQSIDDSGENAMDEGKDIEVIGRSFIRYAIVDIELLFRKLHSLPEKPDRSGGAMSAFSSPRPGSLTQTPSVQGNLSQLALTNPAELAMTISPADDNTPNESGTLQLIRQLKNLRKLEERLIFKLGVIEKIQYDLDECAVWQTGLRGSMRAFAKRQYAMIVQIRAKTLLKLSKAPFNNLQEKLEDKIPKLADEEFVSKNPGKTPSLVVNFTSIEGQRRIFGDVLYEDIDDPDYDQDFETFGSDLEGIMVLSRKISEYKKLIKMQHLYLVHAGKYLNLKDKDDQSRKIFRDRKRDKAELKEFEDILDKYPRILKKMATPPDFVILNKDIFIKDKEDEKAGASAKAAPSGDETPAPEARNGNASYTVTPKKKGTVKSIFEFIESKLHGIREDFKTFWTECAEIIKSEKNKEIFDNMKSDDVIRKRHGELSYDEEAARTGRQPGDDADDDKKENDKDDDDPADEPGPDAPNEDDAEKDNDNASAGIESDNISETTGAISDATSELGDIDNDEKEVDEGGQYLAVFKKLCTFLETFSKASTSGTPALIDMTTQEFVPTYLRLYNEDAFEFPIDEYYDEFDTMMKLMEIFLDEVASIVYSRTTFEIKLLNSSRNIIDKANDAASLRIVFVEEDLDNNVYDDDDDDEGENVDGLEREGFGEDFSYLEEENKEEERLRQADEMSVISESVATPKD
jgi:hypothetical protein